ncbi:lens fiber major intrinsic protein-like [Aplysia californica]|uniref:Lens fiber major intrinsic protein-like n=1 Tax=Aplysia californica TaxID=6500 RepID=A0ABM0K2D3_APLCA|nr:lens fiber major intrinsic protein-like [Aplysia californica]
MSVASIPGQLKVDDQPSRTRGRDQRSVWSRVYQRERDDVTQAPLWRAALAEFVGSFLLVVFTVGVGLSEEGTEGVSLLQVALGCGFFLSVIVSALGGVSGGHVNPAVSLGFLLTGQISCSRSTGRARCVALRSAPSSTSSPSPPSRSPSGPGDAGSRPARGATAGSEVRTGTRRRRTCLVEVVLTGARRRAG